MKKLLLILALFSCSFIPLPQIGDGVIVDTTQGLVEAVANGEINKIYLRAGTYTPQDLTIARDGLELLNYPGEMPIIQGAGYRVLTIYGSDVTVSGITLDGSNAQTEIIKVTYKAPGTTVSGVRLESLSLANSNAHGILVTHAQNVTIANCTITNTGLRLDLGYDPHGIYISDTDRAIVRNNVVFPASGMGVHVYSGSDEQITLIDGNQTTAIGCYYGHCIVQNNIFQVLYLRYNIVSARVYHNTFTDPGQWSSVFINNLRKNATFRVADNILAGTYPVYARNPYGVPVTLEIDHNIIPSGNNAGFPVNEHDNNGIGTWLIPLDFSGGLRADPPTIGATE